MTPLTLAVDQLLRRRGALLRVGGVVFGQQFELAFLPPMVTPLALSSSMAMRAPFSLSLPRWAMRRWWGRHGRS
jgi:hypothetical protein